MTEQYPVSRPPTDQQIGRGLAARRAFSRMSLQDASARVWLGPALPGEDQDVAEEQDVTGEGAATDLPADEGRPVLVLGTRGENRALIGYGDPERLHRLLEDLARDERARAELAEAPVAMCFLARPRPGSTLAQTMPEVFAELVGLRHARDWDWMLLEHLPAGVREQDEVELLDTTDPAVVEAIRDCGTSAIADTWALKDIPGHRWYGLRRVAGDVGSPLDAVIATDVPGTPTARGRAVSLSGFGVRPHLRGQGLGTHLMQGIMRRGLQQAPAVALGLWHDNHGARRLYERLGFTMALHVENWRRPE